MPQDAVTLKRLARDLNQLLSGAKINKINQPSSDEIVISVYSAQSGNHKLAICANAVGSRVGITLSEKQNPSTPPAFCMLLRKHLLSATISDISALKDERIIKIVFNAKNDFFENVEKQMYCEVMGKYSNTIFCENDIILGTMKTSSLEIGKERALLCGAKYTTPKSQNKISLYDKERSLQLLSSFNGGELDKYIFENIVGFAPNTAKEAVFCFFGKNVFENTIGKVNDFYQSLLDFTEKNSSLPCVSFFNNAPIDYYFCDYKTVSGEKKYFDRIYLAESYFFDLKQQNNEQANLKNKLTSLCNSHLKKEQKKLTIIQNKIQSCANAENERKNGELITANLYKIKKGDKQITVDDYYNDNLPLTIKLDEQLNPTQNAQRYFKKYAKLKNTIKAVTPQLEQTQSEYTYFLSVLAEISECNNISDLTAVKEELIENGYIAEKQQTQLKSRKKNVLPLYRHFSFNGFNIYAGKNNIQNDKLTFSSKPADMWLHVKDYHSAHVIIESRGSHIPDEIIEVAAEICAFYSEAKNGNKINVDYTLKKYVKKPSAAKFGNVIYTDYKTITVNPVSHANIEIK